MRFAGANPKRPEVRNKNGKRDRGGRYFGGEKETRGILSKFLGGKHQGNELDEKKRDNDWGKK